MKRETAKASFSIPSIIAILAAISSFYVGAVGGLLLAATAIVFGLFGLMFAMAPGVRGGVVSIVSLGLAVIGLVAAVVKAVTGTV